MIDLKTIVVATDLSDNSMQAVAYACGLAEQFGAHVHLLHIVSHPFADFAETCQKDFGRKFDEYEQERQRAAEEELGKMSTGALSDPQRVTQVVQCGFPVADIPRYADDVKADLLILGTHGRTGLKHVLMGSVCESVVRRSQCPVLTVRSK